MDGRRVYRDLGMIVFTVVVSVPIITVWISVVIAGRASPWALVFIAILAAAAVGAAGSRVEVGPAGVVIRHQFGGSEVAVEQITGVAFERHSLLVWGRGVSLLLVDGRLVWFPPQVWMGPQRWQIDAVEDIVRMAAARGHSIELDDIFSNRLAQRGWRP